MAIEYGFFDHDLLSSKNRSSILNVKYYIHLDIDLKNVLTLGHTKDYNHPKPPTTMHNQPQPPTAIYNHTQPPTTTQKLTEKAKTCHKQSCYCT